MEKNSTLRRLKQESKSMERKPPKGMIIKDENGDMMEWKLTVIGPRGTPYYGGRFVFSVSMNGTNYPFEMPKIKCLTKIYHLNISSGGKVCVDRLKSNNW